MLNVYRYGELIDLENDDYFWEVLVSHMNDELRERVHNYKEPCTRTEFLEVYCDCDQLYESFIQMEFGVTLYE